MKRIKRVFLYKIEGVLKRPLEVAAYFKVSKNTINRMTIGMEVGEIKNVGAIQIERIF